MPGDASGAARSSVADSARTGTAVTLSESVSVLPTQSCRWASAAGSRFGEGVVLIPLMVTESRRFRYLRFWKHTFGNAKDKPLLQFLLFDPRQGSSGYPLHKLGFNPSEGFP